VRGGCDFRGLEAARQNQKTEKRRTNVLEKVRKKPKQGAQTVV
jgi:hypothetical protein